MIAEQKGRQEEIKQFWGKFLLEKLGAIKAEVEGHTLPPHQYQKHKNRV